MGARPSLGVSASGKSPYSYDGANTVLQGTISAVGPTPPLPFYGPMNLAIWGEYTTSLDVTNGSLSGTVGAAGPLAAGAAINSTVLPYGSVMSAIGGGGGVTITIVLPVYTYAGQVRNNVAQITDLEATSLLLGATASGYGVSAGQTVTSIVTAAQAKNVNLANAIRGTVGLSAVATANPEQDTPSPYAFALHQSGAITTGTDAAAIFTSAAIGLTGNVQLERSFDGGQTWLVCNIGGSGALAQWSTATPINISFGEPERLVLYRLNQYALTPAAGFALKYRISETGQAATTLSVPTLS